MHALSSLQAELIYEAEIQFVDVHDFGVTMESITSGSGTVPPQGARFDQSFQGVLRGPRIQGELQGTDYFYVRPDGSFQLHLHGRIATDDGARIALASEGVSLQQEGRTRTQIHAAVRLFTSADSYTWVNALQLCAIGWLDPAHGRARIKAYLPSAPNPVDTTPTVLERQE